MEIYVNGDDRRAFLDLPAGIVPSGGVMDIRIKKDGVEVATLNTVTADAGRFAITIPFFLVQEDAELEICWKFNYSEGGTTHLFDACTYVNIVTPYLPLREIAEMVEDEDDFTTDDLKRIERATRHMINAHTGQYFGKSTETHRVAGTGTSSLELPSRLYELTHVNGVPNAGNFFDIKGDGWYLGMPNLGVPNVRSDFFGFHQHHGGVIHNPYGVKPDVFRKNQYYTLTGKWGWKRIPNEVQEAARLLINDYASGDTVYRDRYLTSMTAADWRIQFHSGAFNKTGNVRADQLLSNFVLQRGWAVL